MTYIKNDVKREDKEKDYNFRRFLSQLIASSAATLLLFDIGLCNTFPFIIVAALTGFHNRHNVNEMLSLTPIEASWLASIQPISSSLGSMLQSSEALFTDSLGRKTTMILSNVPLFIGWYLMYSASSVWHIFLGNILLGIGAGFTESSVINYISEICHPKIRGMMIVSADFGYGFSIIIVAMLNTQTHWRMVGLVCVFIPVITAVAIFFIPETPLWLLSKNRTADAERSLRWLRGWVAKKDVAQELEELQRYSRRIKSCDACIKKDLICPHPPPTLDGKINELKRKQTLNPLFIVMALFSIISLSNTFLMPTYIVQIFTAYNIPLDSDHAAAILSYANLLANILCMILLRFTGKRKLYLIMLSIMFMCAATIAMYGFIVLPRGYSSYPHITPNFKLPNKHLGYIPFVCIIVANFSFIYIIAMPWTVMSELFSYKIRGTTTGIAASLSYVLVFIAAKSFHSLDTTFSMAGVALFNTISIFLGIILMYKILPETENRTLEDIEMHFADKTKKLTDIKILKRDNSQNKEHKKADSKVTTKHVTIAEIDVRNNKNSKIGFDNYGFAKSQWDGSKTEPEWTKC